MNRQRKPVAATEKLAILNRYLVEKVPISDLCDQYDLQPSQIYYWQAQLFEQGAAVFERKAGRQKAVDSKDRKISELEAVVTQKEAKLAQKNEVISELMEENIRAKKANGDL